jgi:membrane protein DedA with SNARE-associated domain
LFPPVVVNLLAGMSTMPWRSFLFYNLTGSAAYATTYTLIGYLFGKKWKLIEAWLGPTALYLILAGIALIVLGLKQAHWGWDLASMKSFPDFHSQNLVVHLPARL